MAALVEEALTANPGPFFLPEFGTADVIFIPYLERMNASLAYYKAYALRTAHPAIDRWFTALEHRSTYLGTQSDIHTHAHDLPPQMGCCLASGSAEQQAVAALIDRGPWSLDGPPHPAVIETRQPEPDQAAAEALTRILRHRRRLLAINPQGSRRGPESAEGLDRALRCALTALIQPLDPLCPPPPAARPACAICATGSPCRATCRFMPPVACAGPWSSPLLSTVPSRVRHCPSAIVAIRIPVRF